MVYINQQPDRTASTILVPGQEPGTTDVVLNVKDRLPIHAGFIYDNYGSRYIDSNRYALTLEDNNLLGFDDRMFAKVQTSDNNYMRFGQLQYVVPVTETLNIGAYGVYSHLKLTKEFAALGATGTAKVLGIFFDKALIQKQGFEWRVNGGFDYKNISNDELGSLVSRDKERVLKLGTELDITDRFGRTIINPEIDVGLPDVFNGMDPKDPLASRAGSGGSFQKWDMSMYRLQPLPFDTSLLWKNQAQWSHDTLPAAEEFELGGPTSVRGYGPDEAYGDKGFYSALEWSVPTQVGLKDSLRFVTFYDFGFVHSNSVAVGEEKNTTLRSYGYGFRLNVRDNLTVRFEVGYPLGRKPADGSNAQPWIEVTMRF
jgi:hemolysin activation/secretion protein